MSLGRGEGGGGVPGCNVKISVPLARFEIIFLVRFKNVGGTEL